MGLSLGKRNIEIISRYPLGPELSGSFPWAQYNSPDKESWRPVIMNFLFDLLICPAALYLSDPNRHGNVARSLFSIRTKVQLGDLEKKQFDGLTSALETDNHCDIWVAALKLINDLNRTHETIFFNTLVGDQPRGGSYESPGEDTVTRTQSVGYAFRGVKGFWNKVLHPDRWPQQQKDMLQTLMSQEYSRYRRSWKNIVCSAMGVDKFGVSLHGLQLRSFPRSSHRICDGSMLAVPEEKRKDLSDFLWLVYDNEDVVCRTAWTYRNVIVVGHLSSEFAQHPGDGNFAKLVRQVRNMFADSPTRRLVHAFTLSGFKMECWVFDRSGAYSSGIFDINSSPELFARAMIGYNTMDIDVRGTGSPISPPEVGGHSVTLNDTHTGHKQTFHLVHAITRKRDLVGRGTACYVVRTAGYTSYRAVAKFTWESSGSVCEAGLLRQAKENGVEGLVQVVAFQRLTTIDELRQGLDFMGCHRWPLDSGDTDVGSPIVPDPTDDQQALWENKTWACLVTVPAGRPFSDFNSTRELLEVMNDAIQAHKSLYEKSDLLHGDISPENIIITPRDAIPITRGSRGMLIDLNMAKPRQNSCTEGQLHAGTVPFMAIELLQSAAKSHTYRHDLESFFYVLLWMCAHESWNKGQIARGEKRPKSSFLDEWRGHSHKQVALAKYGDMTPAGLEKIMEEFPHALKMLRPLCRTIRSALFGNDAGLLLGTPESVEPGSHLELYRLIDSAYQDAIAKN